MFSVAMYRISYSRKVKTKRFKCKTLTFELSCQRWDVIHVVRCLFASSHKIQTPVLWLQSQKLPHLVILLHKKVFPFFHQLQVLQYSKWPVTVEISGLHLHDINPITMSDPFIKKVKSFNGYLGGIVNLALSICHLFS